MTRTASHAGKSSIPREAITRHGAITGRQPSLSRRVAVSRAASWGRVTRMPLGTLRASAGSGEDVVGAVGTERGAKRGAEPGREARHAPYILGMPGRDGGGLIVTCLLGIVGAVVGGFLGSLIGVSGVTGFNLWSILVAVIGAIVVLWLYHLVTRRSTV